MFEDIISSKLPKGLLQMKLITRAEDYTNKEYQRQVQKVLEGKMDKLTMFLSDNIFGRKEVLMQEKRVGQVKQENEDQLDGVMGAYE